TLDAAFTPGRYAPGDAAFLKRNPFGLSLFDSPLGKVIDAVGVLGVAVAGVGGVVSLVVRFRRSTGEERQQLRLLTYTSAFVFAVLVAVSIIGTAATSNTTIANIQIAAVLVAITMIPVSVGVAILRYRLYDIDVVINRTVVLGALAAF